MKQNIIDIVNQSIKIISCEEFSFSLLGLSKAQKELYKLEKYIYQKKIKVDDFNLFKIDIETKLIEAYKQDEMWDNVFQYYYEQLFQTNEFGNYYKIYLDIGNIFMLNNRYEKAFINYIMGIDQLSTNDNQILSCFNLNCGVSQLFLGNCNDSLMYFQKAIQYEYSIHCAYNILLYHFIFSPLTKLKELYSDVINKTQKINSNDLEINDQNNLIIHISCLIASKNEETYEYVIKQLKASQWSDLINEFENSYLNQESIGAYTNNLSFFYYVQPIFINLKRFKSIEYKFDEYEASVLASKGKKQYLSGKKHEAIKTFQDAIKIDSNCFEASFNLAITYKSIESFNDAIEILINLDKKYFHDIDVLKELSDCYEKNGDLGKSIDCFHKILNINPYDPKMWRNLGSIWSRYGKEIYTLQCYIQSIEYGSSENELISWINDNFIQKNKCNEILSFVQNGADYQSKNPAFYMLIASCYEKLNQKLKAIDLYEKAIILDPENKRCLQSIIKLKNDI